VDRIAALCEDLSRLTVQARRRGRMQDLVVACDAVMNGSPAEQVIDRLFAVLEVDGQTLDSDRGAHSRQAGFVCPIARCGRFVPELTGSDPRPVCGISEQFLKPTS
jgi:hypothetical protein